MILFLTFSVFIIIFSLQVLSNNRRNKVYFLGGRGRWEELAVDCKDFVVYMSKISIALTINIL